MTAINAWASGDSATVYTDGAWVDLEGRVFSIAPKVIPMPHMTACMVVRGSSQQIFCMQSYFPGLFGSFDEALRGFGEAMTNPPADFAKALGPDSMGSWQVMLVGWSDLLQGFGGVFLSGERGGEGHGWRGEPFARLVSPLPPSLPPVIEKQASEPGPAVAVELMEMQRAVTGPINGVQGSRSAHLVGGFCQRTHLTRDGINTSIVRRWSDRIGEPIAGSPVGISQ